MKNVYSSQYQTTCFGQSWPSTGMTVSLKVPLCKCAMMWRSHSICYRWKEERKGKQKLYIYIALVMPESPSGGVTYRHGVASVLLFSCGMWVPLWVTGVGSVLHVWSAGLIPPQSPKEGPIYHGRRAIPELPHDDMLHPRKGTPGSPERYIYIVFDSLLSSFHP